LPDICSKTVYSSNPVLWLTVTVYLYFFNLWMNKVLESMKRDAEETSKLQRRFLANMSHKLHTPLNAIIAFNSLLQDANLTETQVSH
jgi:signal transduction histidine kinase